MKLAKLNTYFCNISDCKYLPNTWTGVTTVPTLPVSDNTKLSLFCKDDNTLFSGSSETTCLQGKPYIVDKDPYCRPIGEIVVHRINDSIDR